MSLPEHRFGSTAYRTTARGLALFELKSWLGRRLYRARPATERYLHVGCGANVLPGFENLDFYSLRRREWTRRIVSHDLRFPLPYPEKSFAGAYSEHCLEHLYPDQALRLLGELHRVLKPSAVFRCVVPDLGKYIDFYNGKPVDPEFARFRSGCEAIWSLTQNWGHLSVWDAPMLIGELRAAGFTEAGQRRFGEGRNAELLVDSSERRWESVYVEAVR